MKWFACIAAAMLTVAAALAQEAPPKREHQPMTDEQRAQLEQRLNDAWSKLSVREKNQLLRLNRVLREMPPDEQKFIHERIERFMNMPPEERRKMRENAERWKKMTPEEREKARQQYQQKRREFEEKWRKEHPGQEPPPFSYRKQKSPPAAEAESTKNQTQETNQRNTE
jgi:hypothetical protein